MTRGLWRGLRELLQKSRLDREAADELGSTSRWRWRRRSRGGMDEAEARRCARLELGHPEEALERLRDGRTGSGLDALVQDATYAVRMLRKRPGFSALCILTIALGVGASTALFALVHAVVLKPLPFPAPGPAGPDLRHQPRSGRRAHRGHHGQPGRLATPRAARSRGIAGYYSMGRTLTTDGASEVVLAAQVTEDFFPVLGVSAAVGRTFTAEEVARAQLQLRGRPGGRRPRGGAGPRSLAAALRRRSADRGPLRHPGTAALPRGGGDARRVRHARGRRCRCGCPGTSPETCPATSTTWGRWPGWPPA